jgi:hypothetical protein
MSGSGSSNRERTDGSKLLERTSESRRTLVKAILGAAGAYSVPLLASFPMSGLRIRTAEAQQFLPPGLAAGSKEPPAFTGTAKGEPFTNPDFNPPGTPFCANQFDIDCVF